LSRAQLRANRAAGVKRCTCCKETKPFAEFSRSKSRSDGLDAKCKKCHRDYASSPTRRIAERERSARRRGDNREKMNADARRRYNPEKEKARKKRRRNADPEAFLAPQRKWQRRNRDQANKASREAKRRARAVSREKDREYARRNKEKIREKNRRYQIRNAERIKAKAREYTRAHRGQVNARTAQRTAARLRATPPWADMKAIEVFYIEAARLTQDTGIPHEVDHYYPLQGKTSCGLHVPWNLKIATRTANRRKGNKMPEEYFRAAA